MVKVSVLICSYNGSGRIANALESALDQSLDSSLYELVVVDDGSTDQTSETVGAYTDLHSHINVIRSEQNLGLPSACNLALKEAVGDYIIRLDDDDRFDKEILEIMIHPLEQNVTDLVYSDRYEVDLASGESAYVSLEQFSIFKLTAAGVMMRRAFLDEIGGYRPIFWEEYDLFIRYQQLSNRSFHRVPRPLYTYNRRRGSLTMSRSGDTERQGWRELEALWGSDALLRLGAEPLNMSSVDGQG